MCGIAGWLYAGDTRQRQQDLAGRMAQSLAHRGPDQEGIFHDDGICLIHRRLAVVDREHGRQPMSLAHAGENFTLVYNGELYNTAQLRDELAALGWRFSGHGDTEVLLKALAQWDLDALPRLNGIFAFALWEQKKRRLTLVRDRMGVKPLFYSRRPGTVVFASEIGALLEHPSVRRRISAEGLSELFLLGPGRTPGRGVFDDVEEALPGQWLRWTPQGHTCGRYWQLTAQPHEDDRAATLAHTRALTVDAVTPAAGERCAAGGLPFRGLGQQPDLRLDRRRISPSKPEVDYFLRRLCRQPALFHPKPLSTRRRRALYQRDGIGYWL